MRGLKILLISKNFIFNQIIALFFRSRKFNNLELGNRIVNVANSILDTGNKFIEKAQIKSYFSSYYNWIWGNNNTNSEINESKNYNNNKNIIEYKNDNIKDNNESKENINNDININYNFENK